MKRDLGFLFVSSHDGLVYNMFTMKKLSLLVEKTDVNFCVSIEQYTETIHDGAFI